MIACVLLLRWADTVAAPTTALLEVAQRFSPRVAWVEPHALAIDLHGLERLFGEPRTIGEELRRALAKAGLETHVAVAATRTAARVLAHARAGLTVVAPDAVAEALAALPIALLSSLLEDEPASGVDRWAPGAGAVLSHLARTGDRQAPAPPRAHTRLGSAGDVSPVGPADAGGSGGAAGP